MDLYLPIAEVSVNAPLLVALGALVGFISGMFGGLLVPIIAYARSQIAVRESQKREAEWNWFPTGEITFDAMLEITSV